MKEATIIALESAGTSALAAWGAEKQMVKTCEEAGELIQVLCKRLNGSPCDNVKIVDEIADVLIMAHQMRMTFGTNEVDERIIYKLDRTMEVIRQRSQAPTPHAETIV